VSTRVSLPIKHFREECEQVRKHLYHTQIVALKKQRTRGSFVEAFQAKARRPIDLERERERRIGKK